MRRRLLILLLLGLLPLLLGMGFSSGACVAGSVDTLRDTDRRWGLCEVNSTGAVHLGPVGGQIAAGQESGFGVGGGSAACTFADGNGIGSAAGAPALAGSRRMFVSYTTGAASGDFGSWSSNQGNSDTRAGYAPLAVFIVHSGPTSTAAIWWYGLVESLNLGSLMPSNSQATLIDHAAVAFDAATSSAWRCCSGDGTNASCDDIPGSSWSANVEYRVSVDLRTAGETRCCVKDLGAVPERCVTKTTNQPDAAVDLGMIAGVKTTAAGAKTVSVSRMYLEQN